MFRRLDRRELYGPGGPPLKFINDIYASKSLVRRLEMSKELVGHTGCVNSLCWSDTGQRLLSGSDDTKLCIWDARDYSLVCKIATGHRANIFSAKFMPHTGDTVITSCAGDREIRVFDVHYSRSRAIDEKARRRHVFTCHSGRAKRIVVEDNPWSFLSCSEDGTVRQFDLRSPHNCKNDSCPSALLDLGDYGIELYGLTINSFQPHYLAVCGTSPFMYLYDRRMLRDGMKDCVQRFGPRSRVGSDGYVTGLKFGSATRHELIGTWSDDGIYLFDIFNNGPYETSALSVSGQRSADDELDSRTYSSSSVDGALQPMTGGIDIDLSASHESTSDSDSSTHEMQSLIYEPSSDDHAIASDTNDHADAPDPMFYYMEEIREDEDEEHQQETSEIEMDTQNDNEADPSTTTTTTTTAAIAITGQATRPEVATESPAVIEGRAAFINGDYPRCINIFTRLIRRMNRRILRNAYNDIVFNWTIVKQRDRQRALYYQFRAIGYLFRSRELSNISDTLQYLNLALRDATRASSLNDEDPRNWWIRAVCRWSLVQNEVNETRRDQMLTTAIEHAEKARNLLSPNSGDITEDISAFIREMDARLLRGPDDHERSESIDDISRKRRRSENGDAWNIAGTSHNTGETQDVDTAGQSYQSRDWIDAISTLVQMPEAIQLGGPYHAHDSTNYHSDEESSGLELSSNDMSTNDDDDDDDDDEGEGSMWTSHLPLLHTMDADEERSSNDSDTGNLIERSNSSDEESTSVRSSTDSDEENDSFDEHVLRRFRYRPERYASSVQCYNEVASFKGHCNVATVKDVNFYGPRDEYVISGSDDGNLFIWDKSTGKLLQILEGDDDTVNVTEGHPFEPTLAVSGIDSTVKIFKPTAKIGSVSEPMENMDYVVRANTGPHQRQLTHIRFTHRMLASLMSRMVSGRDPDEEENLVPTCEVQ
ncbi:WD40-repeat-containing domain protein [Syncephalis plumigaleata]|nr:WD40-repeat-containing domain protein [Syncephalis plumigaleata]